MALSDPEQQRFEELFGAAPEFSSFASGRVNLIGEHIDYCGGDVMPMALNVGTTTFIRRNASRELNVYSSRFDEKLTFSLDDLGHQKAIGQWQDYLVGTLHVMRPDFDTDGFDLFISQNIGSAGLSSSASFCMAIAMAVLALNDTPITESLQIDLAQRCQAVENSFINIACGIMDPMSIAIGGIMRLNCQTLDYEVIPEISSEVVFVVMDTAKPRTLSDSNYNLRVEELMQVASALETTAFDQLARIEPASAEIIAGTLPVPLGNRLTHVANEQARVGLATNALRNGRWQEFGKLMTQSHQSLKNLYEVSCDELDIMVDACLEKDGVMGARMTGGGFGGCAVCLSEADAVDGWLPQVVSEYELKTGRVPNLFVARPGPAAGYRSL